MEDAHLSVQRLLPPMLGGGAIGAGGGAANGGAANGGGAAAAGRVTPSCPSWPTLTYLGVFDGHGGSEASAYARQELHVRLSRRLWELLREEHNTQQQAQNAAADTAGVSAPAAGAAQLPEQLPEQQPEAQEQTQAQAQAVEENPWLLGLALRDAFLETDAAFLESCTHTAGSTAVVALVTAGGHLLVANAGDSRACLFRNGRTALPLSVDHKPDRADEAARIAAAGGFVANGRVMHALAVSRAIGDREFKRAGYELEERPLFKDSLVIADPEVRICKLQEGDELLLACDGLWDIMSAAEAFGFLHARNVEGAPQRAVEQLVKAAVDEYNSSDNVTALYARF
jgi:serine/threonine protein phosphatase PrpC